MVKYPISRYMSHEDIKSRTGKSLDEVNIDNIQNGSINAEDIKISREVLLLQSEVAEEAGRPRLKENLVRASELTDVPDRVLLEIYEKLRPKRSTRDELIKIARDLKDTYGAVKCSELVMEALAVYEKRGILKGDAK